VRIDYFGGQIAVRRIPPKGINVHCLHIDTALVHLLDAVRTERSPAAAGSLREQPIFQ